jgi:ElaB/YqjD/DUF883 family membrane-anchored ribosome-binding protein
MADTNETKSTATEGGRPSSERSGSDTASAAKLSGGAGGTVGQPAKAQQNLGQSSTLASHTSSPMGGGAGATGAGIGSRGPEHLRHQDKDAGQGMGQSRAGGSTASGRSTTETMKQAAGQAQERASDLYGQASERAGHLYEDAAERAGELYEQAGEWARDAYEQGSRYFGEMQRGSRQGMSQAGSSIQRFVSENPVLVGVVGLAAGLLLGALLPRTRHEDRTLGRWSDELRDQGMRYARDMTHRGREFMEDAFADGDPRFASHETEWRRDDRQRQGPSGRFQNH